MRTRSTAFMLTVVSAFVISLTPMEASAVADGDGSCSASELAAFECAQFGPGNVIEFLGASNATCTLNGGTPPFGTAPCTLFFYRYSGGTTNQVNVAIPEKFTKIVNDASEVRCSQYITDGSGDPTTGFGTGLTQLGVCRIAVNLSSLPPFVTPPVNANFAIATDPSFIDNTAPLDWQVRQSKNSVFAASIVGPVTAVPAVASTGETLTAANGTTLTYRIVGGVPEIISCQLPNNNGPCPIAKVLTLGQTALCFENNGAAGAIQIPGLTGDFTCEAIKFVDGNPNFKAGENSTCYKYVGGRPVAYSC